VPKTDPTVADVPADRVVTTPAGDVELPRRFVRLRVGQHGEGLGATVVAIAAEQYCDGGCGLLLATALRQWKPNPADHNAKGDPVLPDLGPRRCAACGPFPRTTPTA
jgi:hypothetical protein